MVQIEIPDETIAVKDREEFFGELYERAFPAVAKFVCCMGGTFQDAKDIFQDALVIFYEKTINKELTINVSDESYILGTAKHLWVKKFAKDRRNVTMDGMEREIILPVDYTPTPLENRILNFLTRAGQKCMDMLMAFYYDKLSLDEIASAFGYSNTRSATVQKHKCLEKVKQIIKEKAFTHEDFLE